MSNIYLMEDTALNSRHDDVKAPARIFILGSCVSRDIFEFDHSGFALAGYLARTSMAGFGLAPVEDQELRACANGLQSAFQRSMALNDIDKSTLSKIKEADSDFVLLDFIDERFNLVRTGSSVFSFSGELERAGFTLGERDVFGPGSAAFEHLWLAGFERFVREVPPQRILLNKAYWALGTDEAGNNFSKSWVEKNNAILDRLYKLVELNWSLPTIEYPPVLMVGDSQHRWGVAPYHFIPAAYGHAIGEIRRCLASAGWQ